MATWSEQSASVLVSEWRRHLRELDPESARFLRNSATTIELVFPGQGIFVRQNEIARPQSLQREKAAEVSDLGGGTPHRGQLGRQRISLLGQARYPTHRDRVFREGLVQFDKRVEDSGLKPL